MYRHKYYVFVNLNADTQWCEDYIRSCILMNTFKSTRDRSKALVLAHNHQRTLDTEYGVRELHISL